MITFLKYASLTFVFVLMSVALVANIVLFFEVRNANKEIDALILQIDMSTPTPNAPVDQPIDSELPAPTQQPSQAPTASQACVQNFAMNNVKVSYNCSKFKLVESTANTLDLYESTTLQDDQIGINLELKSVLQTPTTNLGISIEETTRYKLFRPINNDDSVNELLYAFGQGEYSDFVLHISYSDRYEIDVEKVVASIEFFTE